MNVTGLDVIADQTVDKLGLNREESLQLLSRLYNNTMQKPLRRAREDQSDAILISTFGAKRPDGMPWGYGDVASQLAEMFEDYYYNTVGPVEACRDLGYNIESQDEAIKFFGLLMGSYQPVIGGVTQEDWRIGVIKAGRRVVRRDWDAVIIDASLRARRNQPFVKDMVR